MTFQKYVAVALLCGSAQSAASPLPDFAGTHKFPKFSSPAAPAAADLDADYMKAQWFTQNSQNMGPLYAYLNGYWVFPTQKIVRPTTDLGTAGNDPPSLGDQGTTATSTRSFYQLSAAQLGSYPAKGTTTTPNTGDATQKTTEKTAVNDAQNGAKWVVCKDTAALINPVACPMSGTFFYCKQSEAGACALNELTKRIYMQSPNPSSAPNYKSGGSAATVQWTYNADFVIGSFYQSDFDPATDVTDGTKWCGGFYTKLAVDGTKQTKKATKGFSSYAKCTFQLVAADKTVAPVIKVQKMDYANIFINWVEWIKSANMGTKVALPGADGSQDNSDYKIGTYTVDSATQPGLVYINPVESQLGTNAGKWSDSDFNPLNKEYNPVTTYPGQRTQLLAYLGQEGQFKEEQYITFGDWVVTELYQLQKMSVDTYNSMKTTFDGKADTYNVAAKAEVTRTADFFKATFEAKVAVPTRPCPPTKPKSWDGVMLDYARYISGSKTWGANLTAQGKYVGILNQSVSPNTQASSNTISQKLGYLRAAKDKSAFAVATDQVSHTFGLLGQGKTTDGIDGSAMPFIWAAEDAADKATIQVTISGGAPAETGLAAADKFVNIEAKAAKWVSYDNFKAPGDPSDPKSLEKDPNASHAMAKAVSSLLAASVVAASLY